MPVEDGHNRWRGPTVTMRIFRFCVEFIALAALALQTRRGAIDSSKHRKDGEQRRSAAIVESALMVGRPVHRRVES